MNTFTWAKIWDDGVNGEVVVVVETKVDQTIAVYAQKPKWT